MSNFGSIAAWISHRSKHSSRHLSPSDMVAVPQFASLYVGDLHPEVTEAMLYEIFSSVAPVASIRVCRDTVTRMSLGYGYVNFHSVAGAQRALNSLNYSRIKGLVCRIMWSQRDPSLRQSGLGNVFVKNLDKAVDSEDERGHSKGFGFVCFASPDAAAKAVSEMHLKLVKGKALYVGLAEKREARAERLRQLFSPAGKSGKGWGKKGGQGNLPMGKNVQGPGAIPMGAIGPVCPMGSMMHPGMPNISEGTEAARPALQPAARLPTLLSKAQQKEDATAQHAEARRTEEARVAEEARVTEEARRAQERKVAEEANVEEERQARLAEEARLKDEARLAEEAKSAEELRLAEEARLAEKARLAEEARIAEEARLVEEARLAEEVAAPCPPQRHELRELGMLGTGGFGTVTLQEHGTTGTRYALKAISKCQVEASRMEFFILREVDIFRRLCSRFVVTLANTFRDARHVYLLLEVAHGGDLHNFYHVQGHTGDLACLLFHLGCLTEASDFGLSKHCRGRTFTLVGTPGYQAPEASDWYAMGVVAVELATGLLPPAVPSNDAVWLNADGVRSTALFLDFPWERLRAGTLRAPVEPGQADPMANARGGIALAAGTPRVDSHWHEPFSAGAEVPPLATPEPQRSPQPLKLSQPSTATHNFLAVTEGEFLHVYTAPANGWVFAARRGWLPEDVAGELAGGTYVTPPGAAPSRQTTSVWSGMATATAATVAGPTSISWMPPVRGMALTIDKGTGTGVCVRQSLLQYVALSVIAKREEAQKNATQEAETEAPKPAPLKAAEDKSRASFFLWPSMLPIGEFLSSGGSSPPADKPGELEKAEDWSERDVETLKCKLRVCRWVPAARSFREWLQAVPWIGNSQNFGGRPRWR
eukprot:s1066_g20.t1